MSSGLVEALRGSDDPAGPNRGHRAIIAGGVAVLVLALLAGWLVAFSPVFGVRSVTVRGAHALSAQRIEAAARIKHGTPLLRLDTAAAASRIQAALPQVASARVSTSFPSSVTITVTEQVPVGYVKRGKRFALIAGSGAQYKTVAAAPKRLPLFVISSGPDAKATGRALATVASALPARLRKKVASIQALNPDAITLLLNDHRLVRWGSADHSAEKARVLAALLPRANQLVDLTNPQLPFTR